MRSAVPWFKARGLMGGARVGGRVGGFGVAGLVLAGCQAQQGPELGHRVHVALAVQALVEDR